MRTLVNVEGEVIIGRETRDFVSEERPIDGRTPCYLIAYTHTWQYYTGNDGTDRKFKCKVVATNYPSISTMHGKTVNYKRRPNNNWERRRVEMTAAVSGTRVDSNCNSSGTSGCATTQRFRKERDCRDRVLGGGTFRFDKARDAFNTNTPVGATSTIRYGSLSLSDTAILN